MTTYDVEDAEELAASELAAKAESLGLEMRAFLRKGCYSISFQGKHLNYGTRNECAIFLYGFMMGRTSMELAFGGEDKTCNENGVDNANV